MNRFIVSIERQKDGSFIAYNTNGKNYVLIGTGNTITEAKDDFQNSMNEFKNIEIELNGKANDILLQTPQYNIDIVSILQTSPVANYLHFRKPKYVTLEQLPQWENAIQQLANVRIS